jgi:hypothetical protein
MEINNTTFNVGDKIRSTFMPDMVGEILNFNDDGSVLIKIGNRRILGDLYFWEHTHTHTHKGGEQS